MLSTTFRCSSRLLRSFLLTQSPSATCRRIALTKSLFPQRSISYTRRLNAALATANASAQPPSHASVLLYSPSQAAIEDAELDVELLPPREARIHVTDRAAVQLRSISIRESDPDVALRISVESGGCHGYQYVMDLTSERQPDDYHFSHPALKPSNIFVDAVSMPLLKGATLDFATELIGSSFRIADNPQAKGSGCGCGVSWELKD